MATQPLSLAPETADPLEGLSLPGWVYRDPAFFAVEMERVIRPSWQVVCHLSDVPLAGDWHSLELLGESVIVVRGDDGEVRAFHNVCRHRGSRIVDGSSGCARKLVCPYHGWTYERDGRLTGVPNRGDYARLDMARLGLKPVEHEVWRGFVFVRLGPLPAGEGNREAVERAQQNARDSARPLSRPIPSGPSPSSLRAATSPGERGLSVAEMMAPYEEMVAPYRFEEMRAFGRVTLRPRAVNWKNVADNYSDGLHIPVAHPGLTRLFGRGYGIEAERHVDRMWGDLVERPSANLSERAYQRFLPRVAHLPEDRQRHWLYFKLWPNVAFDIYPDQVDFMQFIPVSPTETMIREIAYALPDERREMKAARYLNWRINRQVNAEDTKLIARVQAGMASSSYEPGPLGESEVCLRSFARKLRALIPEARLPYPPSRPREGPGVGATYGDSATVPTSGPPLAAPAGGRGT